MTRESSSSPECVRTQSRVGVLGPLDYSSLCYAFIGVVCRSAFGNGVVGRGPGDSPFRRSKSALSIDNSLKNQKHHTTENANIYLSV